MSFLLPCPNCGERSAYEFRFGGELKVRPEPDAENGAWLPYIMYKANVAGWQREWWFHRSGCREWLLAERNTISNQVLRMWLPSTQPPTKRAYE